MPGQDEQSGPSQAEMGMPQSGAETNGKPDVKTAISETMQKLKAENDSLGGGVFGSYGEGENEVLTFPNSIESQIDRGDGRTEPVDHFLLITTDGFKMLETQHSTEIRPNAESTSQKYARIFGKSVPNTYDRHGWSNADNMLHLPDGPVGKKANVGTPSPGRAVIVEDFPIEEATEIVKNRLQAVRTIVEEKRRIEEEQTRNAQAQVDAAREISNFLS